MTNTAALPLMLAYRLKNFASSTHGMSLGYAGGDHSWDVARRTDAGRFVEARPDLFQLIAEGRPEELSLVIAEGAKPSLGDLAAELAADIDAHCPSMEADQTISTLEMAAAVIAKGEVEGNYGSYYWTAEDDQLHLLSCGPDWPQFRGVTSAIWTEWHGTFAEDTREDRLEARLTCRCDEAVEVAWGLKLPSIAKLIVSLSAGQLEQLFGG